MTATTGSCATQTKLTHMQSNASEKQHWRSPTRSRQRQICLSSNWVRFALHLVDLTLKSSLAAILNDVLDKKYVSAERGADPYAFFLPYFETWTKGTSVDIIADGRARQITQIIDNVSFSTEKKRRASGEWGQWHDGCIELHCVQDADRLDAIGAFGVMRCAAYTSATNK